MAFTTHALVPLAAQYGTSGLKQWIGDNIVTLVIVVLGVSIMWAARSGNVGKGITIAAGAIIGLVVLGLASGNNASDIGVFVVGLFKS
jgi:hypothetical protein